MIKLTLDFGDRQESHYFESMAEAIAFLKTMDRVPELYIWNTLPINMGA